MECFLDDTVSIQSHAFLWEGSEEGSWLSAGAGALPQHAQSCLQTWVPKLCPQPRESVLDAPADGSAISMSPWCLCCQSADTGRCVWLMAWFSFLPRGAQLVHLPAPYN